MNPEQQHRPRQMPRPEPRPASFDMRPPARRAGIDVSRPIAPRPAPVAPAEKTAAPVVIAPQAPSQVQQPVHIPYPEPTASEVKAEAAVAAKEARSKKLIEKTTVKRWGMLFGALVILGVTGYVGFDTWFTNNKVKAEIAGKVHDATKAQDSNAPNKDQEGTDERAVSEEALRNYKVAADLPRILSVDTISLKARVLPMSVNTDGSVQAPININDAGWYTGSVKPNETGAVFIDGHASGATRMGLFAYLDTLKKGDTVSLEKGNGEVLKYRVVHVDIVPLDGIDMKKALLPYNGVTKGLNLMTCTGTWVPDSNTYDHRVLVYTEQVS